MTWRPENGWPWLAGRWAVAAGAGALLGGAVWFGEPGVDQVIALDPTTVRHVELDPREQAELSDLVPDAADADDSGQEADQDERSQPYSAGDPGSDESPPGDTADEREDDPDQAPDPDTDRDAEDESGEQESD